MDRKFLAAILIILVIGGGIYLFGYRQQSSSEPVRPIRIGGVISQTGVAAGFGEYSLNAIKLAADEINARGGINGRQIQLFIEDDHTEGKDAVTAYNKLVDYDKVDGVIGGIFDFTTQPLLPLALSKKVALMIPINARIPGYFDPNAQSFVMLSDFEKIIRNLKPVIEEKQVKRLAIVRFGSEFGKEITRVLGDIMREVGGQLVLDEEYGQIGGNDFRTTILKVKNARPDAVFVDMLDSDTVAFLQRARETGFAPLVMTHDSVIDALVNPTVDKKLLEGVVVLNWDVSTSAFNELYKAKYGNDAAKSAGKSYDAVYILAEAIANSGDRAAVAPYIESHEFKTINGTLTFTKEHAAENTPVVIQIIKDGRLEEWR